MTGWPLYAAACLAFALGAAHSVLGGRYILVRMFRWDDLPRLFGGTAFTRQTLRFAWHITTVAWCGFGLLLAMAADGDLDRSDVLRVAGWTFIASGMLPLAMMRGWHLSWLVLLAVGGIASAARAVARFVRIPLFPAFC